MKKTDPPTEKTKFVAAGGARIALSDAGGHENELNTVGMFGIEASDR